MGEPNLKTCGPESILGKAGTGAVLSLDAIGLQDTYLTSNAMDSSNSFFQFTPVKHTQFTKYSASVQLNNDGSVNWPFNQVVNINFRPKEMGDILNNMYMKCTLPSLTGIVGNPQYCDNVGLAMMNQIQISVDDTILEIIKCDWNLIYSELYYTEEEHNIYTSIVNVDPVNGGNLYIPLHFFFSRKHSSSFTGNPDYHGQDLYFKQGFFTCSAYNHRNITVTITFNPVTFFCSTNAVSLSNFYIVTDEIILGDAERQYFKNNIQKNLVTFTRNDSVYPVVQSPFISNLTSRVSVKVLHWFIRNQLYENQSDATYYNNRFNFSNQNYNLPFSNTSTLSQQETLNPIISQSILYLNGVQLTGLAQPVTVTNQKDGSFYFKFIQPLNHSLTAPDRNIYTYSFCIDPADPQPSGSLDFSQLDSRSTLLNCSLYSRTGTTSTTKWNVYMFYRCFNTVTYNNGLVSLDFGW